MSVTINTCQELSGSSIIIHEIIIVINTTCRLKKHMFLGDFKSKKSISLGGNKTLQDKAALLKSAAEERQKRDLERRRLHAAERIQVSWRFQELTIDSRHAGKGICSNLKQRLSGGNNGTFYEHLALRFGN